MRSIASRGVAPRTVNKARQLICAVFNYGTRPSTYGLATNPAQHADRRREPDAAPLAFYSPEQIEALARSLADGAHRDPSRPAPPRARSALGPVTTLRTRSSYASPPTPAFAAASSSRFAGGMSTSLGRKIIVRRALSGETEVRSTKSRRAREVPLPDAGRRCFGATQPQRGEFTGPDDYVFANRLGRRLDPSALRRRFERARDAAGLEPLRFHDLRHTYGSLLVAGGIDLPSVKAAMGHSHITTTERYLHARPAGELADRFTRALGGVSASPELTHAA